MGPVLDVQGGQHLEGRRARHGVGAPASIGGTATLSVASRNGPPIILADEPTAALDSERALAVMKILNQLAQKFQSAIIVVTHDEKIIPTFKRIYRIRDGKTYEERGEGRPV